MTWNDTVSDRSARSLFRPGSLFPSVSRMSHSEMEQAEAISFLESLLDKTLHITILDGVYPAGQHPCRADRDREGFYRCIQMHRQREDTSRPQANCD